MFKRAVRLSLLSATNHGAHDVSVAAIISSRARE